MFPPENISLLIIVIIPAECGQAGNIIDKAHSIDIYRETGGQEISAHSRPFSLPRRHRRILSEEMSQVLTLNLFY